MVQFRWTIAIGEGQAEYGTLHLRDHLQYRAGGEILFRELVFGGAEYDQVRSEPLRIFSNQFAG
jgi:hypothetical protein